MNGRLKFAALGGLAVLAVAPVAARLPEWATPLLARDVTALAPNARAVVLADLGQISFDGDGHSRHIIRGGIRVMNESGRPRAVCVQAYNADTTRIIGAHAWLVSADGKHTESFGTSDFTDAAAKVRGVFWPQQRTLTFSAAQNIEIKGALFWEYEVESQTSVFDTTWYFPTEMPTVLCSLEVAPPPGGKLIWRRDPARIPEAVPVGRNGAQRWEERDFKPPRGGDRPDRFLPVRRALAIRVVGADGKGGTTRWADIARLASDIVAPRLNQASPEMTAKAKALAAGRTARWDRIRALTEFVQRDVTYLSVTLDQDCLAGYRPHAAAEVFANRYGDCKDKATLLIAMLRAIGDDARPVLAFAGNPTAVLPDWASPRFNHMIVCLKADDLVPKDWPIVETSLGRMVLFDPTDPYTPLGCLPHSDQAGYGLVVDPGSTDLVQLPAPPSHDETNLVLRVSEDGDAVASVESTETGDLAAADHGLRDVEATARFTKLLERRIHEFAPLMENLKWSDSWSPVDAQWQLKIDFLAPGYGNRSGDLLLINPQGLTPRRFTPWKTHAEGVVWLSAATYRRKTRVHLPAKCSIEEMPDSWSQAVPTVTANLRYRQDGADVVCESEVVFAAAFLGRNEYESMRHLLQSLEDATRRPIVVKLSPSRN